MSIKKALRLGVSLAFAALFIWLIAGQVNLDDLRRAFTGSLPVWLAVGLLAFLFGYACRIQRWRLMLQIDNSQLGWTHCAGPLMASFAANNVLPFRAGDVLRAFAFNRQLGVSSGVVIASLFVERLLDLLLVLVLLLYALAWFNLDSQHLAGIGSLALAGIIAGVLLLLLFPGLFAPLLLACGKVAQKIVPGIGGKLLHELEKGLAALRHLAKGGFMFRLLIWSASVWIAEGCLFWCAGLALPTLANAAAGWLALPVATLATLIPSTPGYVGTFDYFTIQAMTALDNGVAQATAYALLVHLLLWLPPTLIGGLYLLIVPSKIKPNSIQVSEA